MSTRRSPPRLPLSCPLFFLPTIACAEQDNVPGDNLCANFLFPVLPVFPARCLQLTFNVESRSLTDVLSHDLRHPSVRSEDSQRDLQALLSSVGPGRWPGQSGKELVFRQAFVHPEMERQATEVGPLDQWCVVRTPMSSVAPSSVRRAVVNSGVTQLIPFGRVPSIAQLGRCLQLRKRATSEQDTGR
jgi:hypothetical protein